MVEQPQGLLGDQPVGAGAPATPAAQSTPQQAGPSPQQPQMPQQQRDYNQNPLGPQDKDEYEKFVISAQKLIHSPQTRDTILKRIGVSQEGPIADIADTVVLIVDRIDQQSAKDQGQPVDNAIKLQGANVVTGQVIEVAEAAGKIPQMSEDERAVAYSYAVQKYTDRMIARGETTREELQKYAQEAVAMGQKSGAIDMNRMKGAQGQPPAQAQAPATEGPDDPMRPRETMSQKLAKGGLLNG